MTHAHLVRIYYEDTDAGGVVYHASYLKFAERSRTEFLRTLGFTNPALVSDVGVMFVVRHMEIDYFVPAFLDNLIRVETSVFEMRNSSIILLQKFYDDNRAIGPICAMRVTLVGVDSVTFKPRRLPDHLRHLFQEHMDTDNHNITTG